MMKEVVVIAVKLNPFRNKSGYYDPTAGVAIVRADRTKYGNKKTVIGDITFDSLKEASRWQELCLLQHTGRIEGLERQVKFELVPKSNDERAIHYIADFVYKENGDNIVEDVKGVKTKEYIIKRKLLKWIYPNYIFRET